MKNNCQGKVIIITGGGTGYGAGMAKALKDQGAEIFITGRRLEPLQKSARELGVKAIQADATVGADWDKVFAATGNRCDILINNAGGGVNITPVIDQTDEAIFQSLHTNLAAAILGCRRAGKIMAEQHSGLIINVSSICAHYGWPGWSVYTAGKAGLDMFSRSFYTEMRPYGVRVTVLTPSWGSTEFAAAAYLPGSDAETEKKKMSPEQMGALVVNICNFYDHLEFPEIMVQPLIQEVVPF